MLVKSRYLISSPFGVAVGNIEIHDTMPNGNINELLANSQIGDTYARARCADGDALVYIMSSSHIVGTAVLRTTYANEGHSRLRHIGCFACRASLVCFSRVAVRSRRRTTAFILHRKDGLILSMESLLVNFAFNGKPWSDARAAVSAEAVVLLRTVIQGFAVKGS